MDKNYLFYSAAAVNTKNIVYKITVISKWHFVLNFFWLGVLFFVFCLCFFLIFYVLLSHLHSLLASVSLFFFNIKMSGFTYAQIG